MLIKSLELDNYRNYKNLKIDFDKGVNILYGNNAQGNEKSPLAFEMARAYGEGDVQTEGTFEAEEILSNSLLNSVNIVA